MAKFKLSNTKWGTSSGLLLHGHILMEKIHKNDLGKFLMPNFWPFKYNYGEPNHK